MMNPINMPIKLVMISSVSKTPLWVKYWTNSIVIENMNPTNKGILFKRLMTIDSKNPNGMNIRMFALISKSQKSFVSASLNATNGVSTAPRSAEGSRKTIVATITMNMYGIKRLKLIRCMIGNRLAISKTPTNITAAAI